MSQNSVKSGPKPPATVITAAALAAMQSVIAIGFGIFLMARDIAGAENESMETATTVASHVGTGTAVFIFIVFGFVLASAYAMVRGWRWGRGAVVLVQFILAASSFQMMSGGAVLLGIATLLSAIIALYLIFFAPASSEWFKLNY